MKIQTNNNLAFNSKIKFIKQADFNAKVAKLNPKQHEVGYPWTENTMKKGKKVFTRGIMDCIAGGIIDENSISMFHLCTRNRKNAKRTRQKGFNIKNIAHRFNDIIDNAKGNVHAFILGGFQWEENSKYNVNKLNKIKKIFEERKIPYTVVGARKNVHYFGKYSLYYNQKEDTMYVTNNLATPKDKFATDSEIDILDDGQMFYHTYTRAQGDFVGYDRKEHKGSVEDFFKSQFRQVKLCESDEFA